VGVTEQKVRRGDDEILARTRPLAYAA